VKKEASWLSLLALIADDTITLIRFS